MFWGAGNTLYLDCGGGYSTVYVCQNSALHTKRVNYTACKLQLRLDKERQCMNIQDNLGDDELNEIFQIKSYQDHSLALWYITFLIIVLYIFSFYTAQIKQHI